MQGFGFWFFWGEGGRDSNEEKWGRKKGIIDSRFPTCP